MPFEPDVDELVSRCVAIMGCHDHFAITWKDWTATVLKIQEFSDQLDSSEVSFDRIRPRIVARLAERFDPETADRLSREVADLIGYIVASSPATVWQG